MCVTRSLHRKGQRDSAQESVAVSGQLVRVPQLSFSPAPIWQKCTPLSRLRYAGRHAKRCAAARCPYLEAAATAQVARVALSSPSVSRPLAVCVLSPAAALVEAEGAFNIQHRQGGCAGRAQQPLSRRCVRNSAARVFIISCSSITRHLSRTRTSRAWALVLPASLSLCARSTMACGTASLAATLARTWRTRPTATFTFTLGR